MSPRRFDLEREMRASLRVAELAARLVPDRYLDRESNREMFDCPTCGGSVVDGQECEHCAEVER